MKETTKISIGGLAFILDKDAYDKLYNYTDALKKYYENKEDGAEITKDIELRIGELLQIQTGGNEIVVNVNDINYIINIIGNPKDFSDEDKVDFQDTLNSENKKTKKKLYRDLDNKVLGGVCSGLGQYFKTDPILIRIVALLLVFIGNFLINKLSLYTIVLYFVLWVIVPAAKSIQQKIEMLNKNSSLDDFDAKKVDNKEFFGARLGKTLLKTFQVVLGILLIIMGLFLITTIVVWLCSTYITGIPSIGNIAETFGLNGLNTNILLFALLIIPTILLFFTGVRIFTKFRKTDFRIIGICILVWFVSLILFSKVGINKIREYKVKADHISEIELNQQYDTLFVDIDKQYYESAPIMPYVPIYINTKEPLSWFILPKINIIKDANFEDIKIKVDKYAWAANHDLAKDQASNMNNQITLQDSVLYLHPDVFSKDNIFNGQYTYITIYTPLDKEVKLTNILEDWIEMENNPYSKKVNHNYAFKYTID